MGISLAPGTDQQEPVKKPIVAKPPATGVGLAGQTVDANGLEAKPGAMTFDNAVAPQSPGKAGGAAAAPMTAPAMTAPGTIPTPTVAAPSAPVDRVGLAQGTFDSLAQQRLAKYNTDSRDNIRTSAAMGQVASGGLRTREGDLRLARDRDLDTLQKDLSLKAAEGSIADASTAYQQSLAGAQHGLAEKIGLAGIENQKGSLDLAKNAQEQNFGLEKEKLGIAKGAQEIANQVALGQLSIAQATAALDEKVRTGQLTIAERNQALAELSQQQQQGNEQQRIQLAKDQLAAEGQRFGLSLAQQKELATLADKTQNRQIDVQSAQGQNSLLLELARIMGSKDLSSIPPEFLASIAKALGLAAGTTPTTTAPPSTTTPPRDPSDNTTIRESGDRGSEYGGG